MSEARDTTDRLSKLHEDYIYEVNAAVGEGRDDLVRRLADAYLEEALLVISETAPQS